MVLFFFFFFLRDGALNNNYRGILYHKKKKRGKKKKAAKKTWKRKPKGPRSEFPPTPTSPFLVLSLSMFSFLPPKFYLSHKKESSVVESMRLRIRN